MDSPLTKTQEQQLFDRLSVIAAIGWGLAVFAIGFAIGVLR